MEYNYIISPIPFLLQVLPSFLMALSSTSHFSADHLLFDNQSGAHRQGKLFVLFSAVISCLWVFRGEFLVDSCLPG